MPVLGSGRDAHWTACEAAGCNGAVTGDGTRCVAHLGADEQAAWFAWLGPGSDLDARGVAFDRDLGERLMAALSPSDGGLRRLGRVRLDGASFAGEVKLDATAFEGPASFRDARFAAQARFAEARFAGPADFSEAVFGGIAWFVSATFEDEVTFSKATFSGAVWLRDTRFRSTASFDGARFQADLRTPQASFAGAVSFAGTSFARAVRFEDDAFPGGVDFAGATFVRTNEIPAAAEPPVDPGAAEAAAAGMLPPPIAAPPPAPSWSNTFRRRWPALLAALAVAGATIVVTRGEGTTPDFAPTALGEDAEFDFLFTDPESGLPARFDPCEPVRYVVNPQLGPADWKAVVTEAVDQLGAATGLEFEFSGETTEAVRPNLTAAPPSIPRDVEAAQRTFKAIFDRAPVQPDRYPGGWAPVLIEWVTFGDAARSDPDDRASPVSILGVGNGYPQATPDGPVYVTGVAAINANVSRSELQAALMHELGHVLGLAHVYDDFSVMRPATSGGVPKWSNGDLAGLRRVGSAAGCRPAPDPPPTL